MSSPKPRATVDELRARSHAGEAVELVDGQIVPKAMPSPAHGTAQAKLSEQLGPFNRKPGGPRGPGGVTVQVHAASQAAVSGSAPVSEWSGAYLTYVRNPSADVSPDHGRLGSRPRRAPPPERLPGGWWIMTEVEILYPQNADVYRHDVVGFRRERHPARPAGLPVELRPDWVCEVHSPTTARVDVVIQQGHRRT